MAYLLYHLKKVTVPPASHEWRGLQAVVQLVQQKRRFFLYFFTEKRNQ